MPGFDTFFDRLWPRDCTLRILVVTDGGGGFGATAGFHLGIALDVLASDPWPYITFEVTRAHRQTTNQADVIDGFRFDTHDLAPYSQIWLFGVHGAFDALSPTELRDLARFMDEKDGGVFATGDHEDLGRALCGEVPRVRSMRRWWYPTAGPNGEPPAPEQIGGGRHDTVMNLAGGGDQSDAIPQPIRPRLYSRKVGGGVISEWATYPHPVLCGPTGVITHLPDHMHEGLCEVPADLGHTWSFAGYDCEEYPAPGGIRQAPEVIAWATSRNTDGDEFGVLAAYDGHLANVGRVLVDATWHHWFNINLQGFVAATTPGGNQPVDPTVASQWAEITAYFRNVALWLAPPGLQTCLRNSGWLLVAGYYDILITHRPLAEVLRPVEHFWQLGVFARDAMGRLASRCQGLTWRIEPIAWPELVFDPWFPQRLPDLPPVPPPWLDVNEMETVALGGAVHELVSTLRTSDKVARRLMRNDREVDAVLQRGATRGLDEYLRRQETAGKEAARIRKRIRAATAD